MDRKKALRKPQGYNSNLNGIPKGIRTPVDRMKTCYPRPLDDGDIVSELRNLNLKRK